MTAIYSGIHLKLKSPQTLWEDKLKLARFAWTSNQCLLPNKEQVLLDWCTHALTGWYNHKVQFSHAVLEGLWCYLDNLLHSRKLHSLLKQGKTITLRLNMAQLLLERLHECGQDGSKSAVCVSTILSVCQGLLSSPALSSVFTTKYELMVDLLAKLSTLACHELKRPLFMEPMMTESLTCQDEVMPDCLQNQHLDNFLTEPISENPPDQLELVAYKSHPKPEENVQSANLFDILLQVLSFYLSVQRQQANPNRVFTMVTNQLIQILVLLRHLLTSGDFAPSHTHLHLRQQLCRDIRTKIDSILHLALFPIEQLNSYKEELLPSKDDSGKRGPGGGKGPLKPVSAILSKLSAQVHCEPLLHYTVKSVTLSLLFKFFLESYGKGKAESQEAHRMLGFNFLTRLVPALNIDLDGHSPSPAKADLPVSLSPGQNSTIKSLNSPESWSLALLSLESLLSQALSADIYNVAADRIRHGEVQLSFYRALAQMLFNQAQPSIPAWYRCLKMLLSLNHLILEPNLDQLSSLAWINSECMEARVQRARQLMVCSLLQTYTKLRQLPCLFSELLSVICQSALNHLRPPLLSEGISSSLRTCLLDTPPSQVFEICSLVLENIKRYILPNLVKEDRGSEEMEIDGVGDHTSDQKRDDASLKLFSMSQILHVVLFSLKTLDHTSPLPIVRQSQGLMEEMQHVGKDLIQMLKNERRTVNANEKSIQSTPRKEKKKLDHQDPEKVSESKMGALWEQRTQEAALLLRYTLVEVDMLLYMHCSKYIPLDSTETTVATKTQGCSPSLMHLESLTFGEVFPAHLKTSNSPISCLLLKILTLQQMKKVLFNRCPLLSEASTATILNRAAKFILAKSDFEASLDGEKEWDGQIWSVKAGSYIVAHWSLITSNLPLIVPYMNGEDVDCVADALVSSLLCKRTERGGNLPSGCLTVSFISSQLLHSHAFAELPSLFSATLHSLTQRIICVFKTAHAQKVCPTLLKFQLTGNSLKKNEIQPLSSLIEMGTIVEDILASTKTGEVAVLLTNTQRKEMANLIQIITELHPDGMNSEDISSIFFLLLFMLTSSSGQSDQMAVDCPGDYVVFLAKLLGTLTCLLEGRHFQSVLKYIHGGTLLQAVMSSLLWHSNNVKIQAPCSPDWLELVKALQAFIRCLVQLIIVRNSSVRLNLDQFSTYLASKEMPIRQIGTPGSADVFGKADLGTSILSVYLLLASLTSFSQTLSSNLGRNKQIDQTLRQMLTRTNASLGPAVESVLKPSVHSHSVIQPTSILGQSFIVEVVTVMLQCELSSLSVVEGKQNDDELNHMSLYQTFCLQILKEVSSAQRPMDFLVSSLHFLSIFYKATRKMKIQQEEGEETKGGKELDELYMQILQKVHRLLAVSWLSSNDVCELEPAVEELLQCLVEKCNTDQFNLMLLAINQRMDIGQLRAGNYREVLSAVIVFKLLARCQLPDPCSRALWHFAPQILSAMVFLVRSSSQDISLTLPFTIPAVISMTSVLRQGEGLITNPHHVILVLGALQFVPLDHLTPVVYQSAFLSVHEAMFTLIQCHPQVMLNAAPTFLNIFHRLVTSIMQEGRQRGDSVTGPDGGVYLECSRLIERMYSHIAATPESFTTLSAFMVAQYVTELQKVTLRPDIKQHLTEGIYRILDLCMEQDIKFLTVGLQMGVREVFNELYASYTRYHKAQRQGEEKYTV